MVDQEWDGGEGVSVQMIQVLLAHVGNASVSSGEGGIRPAAG